MDNFLKYLYDKIPMEKESLKYDDRNIIKIITKKIGKGEISYHLKTIAEVYKISGEIVEYLAKVSEVTVHILAEEIIIVY